MGQRAIISDMLAVKNVLLLASFGTEGESDINKLLELGDTATKNLFLAIETADKDEIREVFENEDNLMHLKDVYESIRPKLWERMRELERVSIPKEKEPYSWGEDLSLLLQIHFSESKKMKSEICEDAHAETLLKKGWLSKEPKNTDYENTRLHYYLYSLTPRGIKIVEASIDVSEKFVKNINN